MFICFVLIYYLLEDDPLGELVDDLLEEPPLDLDELFETLEALDLLPLFELLLLL